MKSSPSFFAVVLFSFLFSLFSQAACSQDFTSIERDLSELESLIGRRGPYPGACSGKFTTSTKVAKQSSVGVWTTPV
jgi:hypothetical protein